MKYCNHFYQFVILQGSPSGEAFIQMDSELAAESAAINRHKKFMLLAGPQGRKRYIEVFQCSSADMSVVLTNPDLPASLQIPGVNIPQTPNFASGLQSTLNLTPPGLSAGASPQQGSPTGQAAPSPAQFSLPQMLQQQQHTPQPQRNPLLSPCKSEKHARLITTEQCQIKLLRSSGCE